MAKDAKLVAVLEAKDNMTATIVKSKKKLENLNDSAKKASSGLDILSKKAQNTKNSLVDLQKNYPIKVTLKDSISAPLQDIRGKLTGLNGKSFKTVLGVKDVATNTILKVKNELTSFVAKPYTAIMNVKANMPKDGLNISGKAGNFVDGMIMPLGIQMAGTAGVGLGAYDTIKTYTDFTAQMSAVKSISGANSEEMSLLTAKAKEMGSTTQFSASEAGKALEYMAMAGWKTEDMLSGISGVMNLAGASGEDLATVSDIVTDALTAFNLTAADSARFSDVLAAASSNSNTNVKMMGETFKYVAPIAGALGYRIEDTAVGIGLMANAGIKGSEAGTALRSVLTRLVAPPKDAAEAMAKLGIQVRNADGSIKPLSKTLNELRSKMNGLSKAEKVELANSLAGQEAMSGLLAMVNANQADFDKLTNSIEKSEGAAKKMNDIRNDNLRGDLKQLASIWEGIQLDIMGDGEGAGGGAGETIRGVVKSLNEELTKFKSNIQTGLNFNAIIEVGKDAIQGLINKTLEFDGIGSILAGGTLILGLTKIYKLIANIGAKVASVINLTKKLPQNIPGNNLPTEHPTSSVKSMAVTAQNVYINSKNFPSDNESIPENNKTTDKKPTNNKKQGSWSKLKDVLKTGFNYGGNLGKANVAIQLPMSIYDIYSSNDRSSALARAGGNLAGGFVGAKIGGATGAMMGSIVPGIGTGAGAIIGGAIGGISGSILGGNVAENIINNIDFSAVGNSAEQNSQMQMQNQQAQVEIQKQLFISLKDTASDVWNSITNTVAENGQMQTQYVATQSNANIEAWHLIQNAGSEAWEWIKATWNEAVGWFESAVYDPLKNSAQSAGMGIANGINSAISVIKSAWQGVKDWFNNNVFAPIKNQYVELKNSSPSFIQTGLNYFDGGIGKNATGTMNWRGGLTQINEQGGEIVDLPSGSRIYPAQTTERIISRETVNSSSNTGNITITGNTFIVQNEHDIDEIAYKLMSLIRQVNANYGGDY